MQTTVQRAITSARSAQRYLVPIFLCPALLPSPPQRLKSQNGLTGQTTAFRQKHRRLTTVVPAEAGIDSPPPDIGNGLPFSCPGCGALTQTADSSAAGFYSTTRKLVKGLGQGKARDQRGEKDRQVYESALANAGEDVLEQLGLDQKAEVVTENDTAAQSPICDRCHDLVHHRKGVPIHHPSLQSIQDTIAESPHEYNHIYHILDAVDFPMSLIPNIHRHLSLTPQRSQNRRSKSGKYHHGRKAELSFVITRSDLLVPKKEDVDQMMPYLTEVLRDALGSSGQDMRLGNVRCVSSKRGWWTKELKDDIRRRGGGGWMVGKVNVGKSNLLECIYPKGATAKTEIIDPKNISHRPEIQEPLEQHSLEFGDLLPPAPPETPFPILPTISSLPGTTASPIRLPFGNGKGELIDLPGLARGDLAAYVQPEYRHETSTRTRSKPQQHVLKPGQSLLLGGLIRITPASPSWAPNSMDEITMIAYAFVPLPQHLTATEKAAKLQTQQHSIPQQGSAAPISLLAPDKGECMRSAGRFALKWDVTRQHTGPLTSKSAAKLRPEQLAFKVFSTDILVEGCGWVELTAQVNKRKLDLFDDSSREEDGKEEEEDGKKEEEENWSPMVEVFSPEGRFVAARRPMNAWLCAGRKKAKTKLKGRPRRSMKGAKARNAGK